MQVITTTTGPLGEPRRIRIAVGEGKIVVHNLDTSELIVERPVFGFEQLLADEIDRLKTPQ